MIDFWRKALMIGGFFYYLYGMELIKNYLAHLERLKEQIPDFIRDAILENSEYIISVLQDNQLALGKDSTGAIVGTYSWATNVFFNIGENRARSSGQPKEAGEPYNFEWTGEFFDSMTVRVNSAEKGFDIYSTTGKDRFLEKEFNSELTRLTPENNELINRTVIEPYVAKQISSYLFVF